MENTENGNVESKNPKRRIDITLDLDKMEELMDKMMGEMFEQRALNGAEAGKKPLVMGFSVKMGQDGNAHIESFGNVKPRPTNAQNQNLARISDVRAPLTDIVERGDDITITAEMPGVEKNDVKLEINSQGAIIRADKPAVFYKRVSFPASADPKTAKINLTNGILEITVKKAPAQEPKAVH
ncbi:Hsp20/alpha crystallin family protein [Candidatus Micrarchaeota archaeon]|nr:Hsp20/alpha crystallin family protein [Candidatus Micrarchaeota archaeon]MBU1939432.1 Hsp20/alpha crystallin family protein [Candidatus Micrarchaeota archaeon]